MIRDREVDAQMGRILKSSIFASAARSRQFLEFCVGRALRGEVSDLKETTIAVEVFLRATDYDPKSDPIVRVHARRVREKLDQYYRTEGAADPIRIELPKGGYVPQILRTLPMRRTEFSGWEEQLAGEHIAHAVEHSVAHPSRSFAMGAPPPADASRNRHLLIGAILAVVALAGFSVAWIWRGQPHVNAASFNALSPVDLFAGNTTDSAWSPDGRWLAVAMIPHGEDQSHIYIQDVHGDASPVRLTEGSLAETRPVWSPDGREIAFTRRVDMSHFEVARFNLAAKTLNTVGRFVSYWPIGDDHPALDWSSDGRFLLTTEQPVAGNPMRIVLISAATGERTSVTSPPIGSSGDIDAKFSPDGSWIAFRRGGLGDLYMVSVKGEQVKPATRLTFDTDGVRGIAWIDHGRSILYGTQRSETAPYGLWRIARDGGTPQPVTPADFDAINPSISPTGTLVFEHRQLITELIEQPLAAGGVAHTPLPSDKTDSSPVYSPDGRSIAFVSTRSGWGELWLYRTGSGAPVQLTHFHGEGLVFPPSWSPDGRSIAFSFRKYGATNLMVCDLASRSIRTLTTTRKRDFNPVYSADGAYLFFSSNEDGTSSIWRMRVDGTGRPEPLFVEAVASFLPSADGQWLYFIEQGAQLSLSRRSLVDGSTEQIFQVAGRATFTDTISIAGNHVYVAVSQSDLSVSDIFEIDPAAKHAHVVAHLRDLPPLSASGIAGFSVSPDRRTLIVDHTKHYATGLYEVKQGLTMPGA
jgi:Tol biopolymer transport system component